MTVVASRQIVAQNLMTVVACRQIVAQDLKAVVASRQIVAQDLKAVAAWQETTNYCICRGCEMFALVLLATWHTGRSDQRSMRVPPRPLRYGWCYRPFLGRIVPFRTTVLRFAQHLVSVVEGSLRIECWQQRHGLSSSENRRAPGGKCFIGDGSPRTEWLLCLWWAIELCTDERSACVWGVVLGIPTASVFTHRKRWPCHRLTRHRVVHARCQFLQ